MNGKHHCTPLYTIVHQFHIFQVNVRLGRKNKAMYRFYGILLILDEVIDVALSNNYENPPTNYWWVDFQIWFITKTKLKIVKSNAMAIILHIGM